MKGRKGIDRKIITGKRDLDKNKIREKRGERGKDVLK